jgi:hypothetical protein
MNKIILRVFLPVMQVMRPLVLNLERLIDAESGDEEQDS